MSDVEPWRSVINLEQIHKFHDEALQIHHGLDSAPKDGCLEQCLGNAWTAERYQQEKGLTAGLVFSAYLLIYLSKDHCYADGNKRIAWMSVSFVLRHYGLSVEAPDDDVVAFVNEVAENKMSVGEVIEWLTNRLDEVS